MNPETDNESEFAIDLTQVKKKGESRFLFPDGEYEAIVTAVEKQVSSSGNPMLKWTFEGGEDLKNTGFFYYTVLTPQAIWKAAETVVSLGLGDTGSQVNFKRSEAIGRRALIRLEAEEYNGQKMSKIEGVKPHPQGPVGEIKGGRGFPKF